MYNQKNFVFFKYIFYQGDGMGKNSLIKSTSKKKKTSSKKKPVDAVSTAKKKAPTFFQSHKLS